MHGAVNSTLHPKNRKPSSRSHKGISLTNLPFSAWHRCVTVTSQNTCGCSEHNVTESFYTQPGTDMRKWVQSPEVADMFPWKVRFEYVHSNIPHFACLTACIQISPIVRFPYFRFLTTCLNTSLNLYRSWICIFVYLLWKFPSFACFLYEHQNSVFLKGAFGSL